jgi:NAD(P)-dependent dehydrogenase (short-subunit alcohol dehydrogenase family)
VSRTVVVTGAGSGIGAGIARAFVELGDHVYGCDISRERIEQLCAELGDNTTPVVLDVSDEEAVQRAVRAADEETGRLDVLVNNAGVGDGKPPLTETTTELWRRVLDINLSGSFYAGREAARIMLPRGAGRIINVASISTFSGRVNGIPYTVSKAGVFGLTQRMAFELGPHGITVNAILPGTVESGIAATTPEVLGDAFPGGEQPRTSDEALRMLVPAGRRGSPGEVAVAAVFLASEAASYVNGVMLPVDGGWLAA